MSATDVLVVRTGTANTASVVAALARAGLTARLSEEPGAVADAERVVLPGVGALGVVMAGLRERGLAEPLAERVRAGRPTLAICLGIQLLALGSDESPEATGLGVLPVRVTRLSEGVRVPHMGWNLVEVDESSRFLTRGYAYFAHSYGLEVAPPGWLPAWTVHGKPCIAALERGPVLACQFHPELSGAWGARVLARWLALSAAERGASC